LRDLAAVGAVLAAIGVRPTMPDFQALPVKVSLRPLVAQASFVGVALLALLEFEVDQRETTVTILTVLAVV
jgi:hypothetical protein